MSSASSELESTVPSPLKKIDIVNVHLAIPLSETYAVLSESATHQLIGIKQTIRIANIPPDCLSFVVNPGVLPFGLLQSVNVVPVIEEGGGDGREHERSRGVYSVAVAKVTGQKRSEWTAYRNRTSMVEGDVLHNDDAHHQDLKRVKEATGGHDLRFRMIAASSVGNISIVFKSAPPSTVDLIFTGANAIPVSIALSQAAVDIENKKRIPFLLQPITPKARLEGAVYNMKQTEQTYEKE
jgi:hypothetical protein